MRGSMDYWGDRKRGKRKRPRKDVYEDPIGFERLRREEEREDEEEEEDDKPLPMVDSSEDEFVEIQMEGESEESDGEDDKLFYFLGTFLIPTWEASPVPEKYKEDSHRRGQRRMLWGISEGKKDREK